MMKKKDGLNQSWLPYKYGEPVKTFQATVQVSKDDVRV
jgi:hypothetical protein